MPDYMETHDVTDDYGNRLYSVTTVQNDPTWFAASDTATATRVAPAQAFAALREKFAAAADAITDPNERYNTPPPAPYGIPTSTDRIDALTKQVDALREQQAAIVRQLHDISEQMAAGVLCVLLAVAWAMQQGLI